MKKLEDIENHEIRGEIKEREELIYYMSGWLYPSILRLEIDTLKQRLYENTL